MTNAFPAHLGVYSTISLAAKRRLGIPRRESLATLFIIKHNLKFFLSILGFVTGRGGAGLHSPGPALTRGRRGGIFGIIAAPPPSRARPH